MRRRLALVFVALAVMLAVGFLVPLGRSVKSQAELRTLTGAQSDARGAATALAAVVSTTGRSPSLEDAAYIIGSFETENIVILLPDDMKIGRGVPDLDLRSISKDGSSNWSFVKPRTLTQNSSPKVHLLKVNRISNADSSVSFKALMAASVKFFSFRKVSKLIAGDPSKVP